MLCKASMPSPMQETTLTKLSLYASMDMWHSTKGGNSAYAISDGKQPMFRACDRTRNFKNAI